MKSLALLLMFAGSILAADGPRIFIVTDFEGVGGVNDADEQLLPGQRRYEESRRLLTGEVNSAVEGALDAGASEVVVWDGHDGSRTLSVDAIHPKARLIQGKPTPANYYLEDRRYDGVIFIGQHAMAGTKDGILSHSQSFSVQGIYLNGNRSVKWARWQPSRDISASLSSCSPGMRRPAGRCWPCNPKQRLSR